MKSDRATKCVCCENENGWMYEGTSGTVYCYPCSRRGGDRSYSFYKCTKCWNKPTVVTEGFQVEVT